MIEQVIQYLKKIISKCILVENDGKEILRHPLSSPSNSATVDAFINSKYFDNDIYHPTRPFSPFPGGSGRRQD